MSACRKHKRGRPRPRPRKARMQPPEQVNLDQICGLCGGRLELAKSWELKGRGAGKKHKPTGTQIDLFKCAKCGGQVRRSRRLPEKESETHA